MFNQSIQFIFSHILTTDKLEPFKLLFTIINVSIEFVDPNLLPTTKL